MNHYNEQQQERFKGCENMQNNGQQQERSQGCKNMSHYNEPLQERSRVREQEQPADTVRQAIAREEPGV
jgi:hypothetical protein